MCKLYYTYILSTTFWYEQAKNKERMKFQANFIRLAIISHSTFVI